MAETFDKYKNYSVDGHVTLQMFQSFLINEQQDDLASDDRKVSTFIRNFLQVFIANLLI